MIAAVTLCLAASATMLTAQASFEVASIRRSPASPAPAGSSSRMQPGGSYVATNMTVQQLIATAYGVPTTRVFEGPGWVASDRYDIAAKAGGNPTSEETGRLIQALLRDRFNLAARVEQRVLPVYALGKARSDGSIGPRLWSSDVDGTDRRRYFDVNPRADADECIRPPGNRSHGTDRPIRRQPGMGVEP
jgi:uncharacterized protein (TIGR03435 family)